LILSVDLQAFAQEIPLYEETQSFPVTKGVVYESKTLFTSLGWQKIHVLKVDLSSKNVDLDTLIGSEGLSRREPLSKMVIESGAVAGINGDFFIMSTPSSPIGVQIKDGKLVSSPSNRKDMAAIGLTWEKIPQILRMEYSGKIVASDGASFDIGGLNKLGNAYGKIFVYTPEFGSTTPAPTSDSPNLTFAVTQGEKVVSIFDGRAANIPSDGMVLVAGGEGANFIKSHLSAGDTVKLDLAITPDISNLKMAMGGGAVLVENGKIPASFSHNIPGQNPRTAVGFSSDKKTMILVVVDGRQAQSRGVTQQELAELMVKLGASDAVNLDGGGSSTMVVRPLGEKQPKLANSVSEGVQRPVPNGIGIFSTAPPGKVYGFKIAAASFNVPKGGHRVFEVLAYDENYNPVDVDPAAVQWSVTGGLGKFYKNVFAAAKSGTGKVTATLGGIKATQEIRVLEAPVTLSVAPGKVQVNPGAKTSFEVYVTDKNGYKAPVEPFDVNWQVLGGVGTVNGSEFTAASNSASGAVIAGFSGLKSGAPVLVGTSKILLDNFEKPDGKGFTSYPAGVGGSFNITTQPEPVYSGRYSGRLSYDFSGGEGTKAAYLTFGSEEQGFPLPEGTEKIGLWVYGQAQGHWLRGMVKDSEGKEYTIDFAGNINWLDWRWVEASLPQGKGPFNLKRIYVVETDPSKNDAGSVYLDDLTAIISIKFDYSLLPPPPALFDEANTASKGGGLVVGAFGDLLLTPDYSQVNQKTLSLAASQLEQNKAGIKVISGRVYADGPAPKNLQAMLKNFRSAGSGYATYSDKEAFFIFLDASKGSLRLTDYNQWIKLQADLKSMQGKNKAVFVVVDRAPEAFSDPLEGELLKKLLSGYAKDGKCQIWVLYGGAERFGARMEEGVHYVSMPGVNAKEPAVAVFNVSNGLVSYRVIPLIEKIQLETSAVKNGVPSVLRVFGIAPGNRKISLTYPYAVSWKFNPEKSGSFDPRTLTFNARISGSVSTTVKAAGISATFNLSVLEMTVKLNGKEMTFPDQQPYINKNMRTMVPVRFISEGLGAKVGWDEKSKTVTIEAKDRVIKLRIGENKATVNGKTLTFDTKAEFKNGRTMVPLRFVSEAMGAKVSWDEDTKTVEINMPDI
jgi:hypothetical protein